MSLTLSAGFVFNSRRSINRLTLFSHMLRMWAVSLMVNSSFSGAAVILSLVGIVDGGIFACSQGLGVLSIYLFGLVLECET
jgi:hypothetical protein